MLSITQTNYPLFTFPQEVPTFRDFVENIFWPDKKNLANKTKDNYRGYIRRYLMPHFADMPLDQIGYQAIQHMINCCPTYKCAKDAKCVLSSILGHATDNYLLLPCNMAARKYLMPERAPYGEHPSGIVLQSFDQIFFWIQWLKEQDVTERVYRAALTGLGLGLRPQESCGLDETDIDLADRVVRVYCAFSFFTGGTELKALKTQRNGILLRELPIPDYLFDLFAELKLGKGPYIRKASGKRENVNYLGKTFFKIRANHNMPRLTCQTMRHSFATACIKDLGMDVASLQRWLGHKNLATTISNYVIPSASDLLPDLGLFNSAYDRYVQSNHFKTTQTKLHDLRKGKDANERAYILGQARPLDYSKIRQLDGANIQYHGKVRPANIEKKQRIEKVYELLSANEGITLDQIARKLDVSLATIKRDTKTLRDTGRIIHLGSNKNGTWRAAA